MAAPRTLPGDGTLSTFSRAGVEALFDRALELKEEDRESWLRGACGEDRALLAEVRALLAAHLRAGGILDRPPPAIPIELIERARPPVPLGPYRILKEIGRGGMSVVYLAERADGQFYRRVALKVLQWGADAEEVHQRLALERQILAGFDHPGIARLLDGGMTEDGRPYLVMEYVEGLPVTDFADGLHLDVEGRLRLFLEIARAVHHAHTRLVVHRDLKPSNVFVTPRRQVRLLDFGIAKVLDPDRFGLAGSETPVTRAGTRLFTPAYASPEQLSGAAASTANDVWALGVMLHELLTGLRPFPADPADPAEGERRIREVDAPAPSAHAVAVVPGEPSPDERASRRSTMPRLLARELKGDLDRIVQMALRKEPDRRYRSAEQLADDVDRHLRGMPVRAQPDRLAYRTTKFLRRRRVESGIAALALCAILAGAGVALSQAREARSERDRAELAAFRAEAVSGYLMDLFRSADPWEVPGDVQLNRDFLARVRGRLGALPDDPVLRSRVLLAIAGVYESLGDPAAAAPLLEEAVDLRRTALGPGNPATGEALRAHAEHLRIAGHFEAAEHAVVEALEGSRAAGGADAAGEAAGLSILGFIRTGQGRLPDAEEAFREELSVLSRAGLQDDEAFGHALVNLAAVHRRQRRFEEAEGYLRQALANRERALGPDHQLTQVAAARLASLLWQYRGQYEEAERLYRSALEQERRLFGPDHPIQAEVLAGLSALLEQRGEAAEAEAYRRDVLRIQESRLGSEHPLTLSSKEALSRYLQRAGRLAEAEVLARDALAVRRRVLGAAHPSLAGALNGWGTLLVELGRLEEAAVALEEAIHIREQIFGARSAQHVSALRELGMVRAAQGRHAEAERHLARATSIAEEHLEPDHPDRRGLELLRQALRTGGVSGRPREIRRTVRGDTLP